MKVLQYNLFLRPLFIQTNGDDYTEQRMNHVLANVANYDHKSVKKICENFKQKLTDLGFTHQLIGPQKTAIRFLDSGLLVASKFPFSDSKSVEFKNKGHGNDFFMHKGFIHFQITHNAHVINFFNIHTQASYYHHNLPADQQKTDKYFTARYIQLKQIMAFAASLKSCIFLGDLNIDYFASSYENRQKTFKMGSKWTENSFGDAEDRSFQYDEMMRILSGNGKVVDSFLLRNAPAPTFGCGYLSDGLVKPSDEWLTYKPDQLSMQRLDYVLVQENEEFDVKCEIEMFDFEHKEVKFASDHFGNAAEIVFRGE